MKRIFLATTAVVISLGVLGGAAIAASDRGGKMHRGHGPMGLDFSEIDTDANGEISMDEITNMHAARFAAADTDGDGFLSQSEMEARAIEHVRERMAHMLEQMDENGDGKLALDEMPHRRNPGERMFKRMDADNNGSISQAEFDEARGRMRDGRMHYMHDD